MYEKILLENGVRIVSEYIPHVRSVSVGIWVGNGSRHESPEENGASHYIEHMLFKGTEKRTAMEIAQEMDGLGGQMNAFTTKECTCYYGRVLDSNLLPALDILFDMFFSSSIDNEDVESERGIIFEEIDMYEDSPEDLVTERLIESVYAGTSLSRPILGTKEALTPMDSGFLKHFMGAHYLPDRIVVAISGNFTQAHLDYIKSAFRSMGKGGVVAAGSGVYRPAFTIREKPIEQNHLCLAFPGLSAGSEKRYACQLLSNILGGGMSSRLFQTVREQNGLCYSIYSFGSGYHDTGILGIYTALNQEAEDRALRLITELLSELLDSGVSQDELHRSREQVKSNVLMSLESTNARMNRLGKNELYLGKVPSADEIIHRYDEVTREELLELAREQFDFTKISFSAVGQVADPDHYRAQLRADDR